MVLDIFVTSIYAPTKITINIKIIVPNNFISGLSIRRFCLAVFDPTVFAGPVFALHLSQNLDVSLTRGPTHSRQNNGEDVGGNLISAFWTERQINISNWMCAINTEFRHVHSFIYLILAS